MRRGTDKKKAEIRSLLEKIRTSTVPLMSVDDGCPFNLLTSALKGSIPPHRLVAIEPPTFGSGSVESFFDLASPIGPIDRWILPILASSIMDFVWQETTGGRPLPASSHDVFEALGSLPVRIPHQDIQDRLGNLVQLVRASCDDAFMVSELKIDLEAQVYSVYGLDCSEIDLIERVPDGTLEKDY